MKASIYLDLFQPLMSLGRETLPQLTAVEARKALGEAARMLGLELIEKEEVIPSFILSPPSGVRPVLTLFATWHAEPTPVTPAAVEGAERLALAVTLAALGAARTSASAPISVVIAPASTHGSRGLAEFLERHRERLQAPVAFWVRAIQETPRRRRVYLGSRGRVILGIWGEGVNAYRLRDDLIRRLSDEAYGPRPLDFELLRKLGQSRDALDFLEETLEDPQSVTGEGEERLRRALFEPRGQIVAPPVRHGDRPQAWLILETAENMEPADLLSRAQELAGGAASIEMAEGFLWDRINIHHPAVQAEISLSKAVSAGPDIWPMAPWPTPSGLFTRALGTPLAEWGVPLPHSTAVRFPRPEAFEAMVREASALMLCGAGVALPTDVLRAE